MGMIKDKDRYDSWKYLVENSKFKGIPDWTPADYKYRYAYVKDGFIVGPFNSIEEARFSLSPTDQSLKLNTESTSTNTNQKTYNLFLFTYKCWLKRIENLKNKRNLYES